MIHVSPHREPRELLPLAIVVALVIGIVTGERLGASDGRQALLGVAILVCLAVAVRARAGAVCALLAVVLLGAALTQRALDGQEHWPLSTAVDQRSEVVVTGALVDDPDGTRFTSHVLVRLDRARVEGGEWQDTGGRTVLVAAESDAGPRLALLDAGDRVRLRGYLRPLEGFDTRLRWRHAVARLDAVELLTFGRPTGLPMRIANALRRVVLRGVASLPPTERGLMGGFLLGDTRAIPDTVLEQFRSAGLSHLLAVSGANVAFALALVGPLLRRLPRTTRLVATIGVLAVFGAMTRWEPSVLRASAMTACAVLAVHVGRPVRSTRTLAIAATLLLGLDPFLLHSVGFQLSCGASLGIALLAPRITARLRGPAWFRECLGTTAAAQVGVAPVLLPVFGSVPLVALPANLVAVPLAGPLTMWGLAAGALGGVTAPVAPAIGALAQAPTRLLADAMLGVADLAARVPIALDATAVAVLGALIGIAVLTHHRRMLRRDALVVPPR